MKKEVMKKVKIEISSEMNDELEYQVFLTEVMVPNDMEEDDIEMGKYDDEIFEQIEGKIDFEPYEIYVANESYTNIGDELLIGKWSEDGRR